MEHPAALHFRYSPCTEHEMSSQPSVESFEPHSTVGQFPLTRTIATQTDPNEENIAAAAGGFGYLDMGIADLARNHMVDTYARQFDLNRGSDDELSPDDILKVLLSLRDVQPVDAAWPRTYYSQFYEEDDSSPFLGGESARKLCIKGRKHSPRSLTSNQPLNGSRAESGQSCANCGVTESSLWRKEKGTNRINCNACGLYFNTKGQYRNPHGKAMRSGVKKVSPKGKARTGGRRRMNSGRLTGRPLEPLPRAVLGPRTRSSSPVLEVAPAPLPLATQTDNSHFNEGIPMPAPEVVHSPPQPILVPSPDLNPVPLPLSAADQAAGQSQQDESQIRWSPVPQEPPLSYYHVMGQLGGPSFASGAAFFHPRLLGASFQQ